MRQRKLVIGLLVMLALVVSSFTYAYWAGTVNQAAATPGTVTIGSGGTSTVTLVFDEASVSGLVPHSVDPTKSTAVLTFDVEWKEDALNTAIGTGTLSVALGEITLGTALPAEIEAMFDISITAGQGAVITMDGDKVTISVTVFFENAPASQSVYAKVAGGTLTIPVTVTVNMDTNN